MNKRIIIGIIGLIVLLTLAPYLYEQTKKQQVEILTVSTTTSLYDTGLLDEVARIFKEKYGIEIHFIAKGTGAAINDAKLGISDAILVHAKSLEEEFLKEGYGVNRKIFAYNFFVIVGPKDDPAKIRGLNVVEAMRKIVEAGREGKIIWVSRGDLSGTNVKEISLWKAAGFNYEELRREPWFRETGAGMGQTLLYTNNIKAYTLSDISTYLKYKKEGRIDNLEMLVDKGEELINVYSIIIVKDTKKFDLAMKLEKWLVTEGQEFLKSFGREEFGRPLFYPAVEVLENKIEPYYSWIIKYGFINGTECPEEYRYKAEKYGIKFY
ncbi:MAG TPA: tungsten ABC transporter permease [Archaeoglobus profundus]|nr:tungsten ABC transporter permease [Archaeoglobus profundus]